MKIVMKSTVLTSVPASQKKASVTTPKKPVAKKKTTAKTVTARKKLPAYEDVSLKAYEIFMERVSSGEPGNPESDWHKALDILQG
jgi:hypothetical protein